MGKQIQVQKLKERQEEKRRVMDKVELLKKRSTYFVVLCALLITHID